MSLYTIEVTEEDIQQGQNCDPRKWRTESCPLAIAIRRASGRRDLMVGLHRVFCFGEYEVGLLPDAAVNFRRMADDNLPLNPFSFEMELRSK